VEQLEVSIPTEAVAVTVIGLAERSLHVNDSLERTTVGVPQLSPVELTTSDSVIETVPEGPRLTEKGELQEMVGEDPSETVT